MSIKDIIKATVVAVSIASVSSAANITVNFSDIILGFRSTASTTSNYEVNLGSVSQFTQAAAGTSFVVGDFTTDLTTAFGSTFNATTTKMGLIGTTGKLGTGAVGPDGQELSTVYASGKNATAYIQVNSSTNNNAVDQVLKMATSSGNPGALVSVVSGAGGSTFANSAIISAAASGSWSNAGGTTGSSFVNYARANTFEGSLGATTTLGFYELAPVSGIAAGKIGTFSLTSGVLTFTSAGLHAVSAVPEPSTYAALAGAAVLGLAAYRRRSAVRA